MQVFITYRRSDTQAASRQLAEALKLRFGRENVFFDTSDIGAGVKWKGDTVGRVRESDVVLALIGPHWAESAEERARRGVLASAEEDIVRLELETAFAHGASVVPVLVDDARMPARESLPRPFRPLVALQALTLRHTSWNGDVDTLARTLVELSTSPPPGEPSPDAPGSRATGSGHSDVGRIARYLVEGSVVTVLGSGANAVTREKPWEYGCGSLPDAAELARHLAREFEIEPETDDLARASEHVSLIEGRVDLYRTLRDLLIKPDDAPCSMHCSVARTPRKLRELDRERYQLLITTNYDSALERAFDELHDPYDLVVFVATGAHRGRFVHVPWWDPGARGPQPIAIPNEYVDLPIDEDGELERTVIVKLHGGGADLGSGWPRLRDNYVITEDDYIGYLTQSPIESLIPLQLLNKLRDSHLLFLGYGIRDWSSRVFLQRVWGSRPIEARSWAVDTNLHLLERELWEEFGVNVVEEPVAEFLAEIEHELASLDRRSVAP